MKNIRWQNWWWPLLLDPLACFSFVVKSHPAQLNKTLLARTLVQCWIASNCPILSLSFMCTYRCRYWDVSTPPNSQTEIISSYESTPRKTNVELRIPDLTWYNLNCLKTWGLWVLSLAPGSFGVAKRANAWRCFQRPIQLLGMVGLFALTSWKLRNWWLIYGL